jgi:hypothetical protein
VRVRYDRAALLGPHHQCIGGTGAPREDQGHSGLADTQECDRIEELLRVVQLLQAVRPYRIMHRVGEVAYELELPEGSKIHNVFHMSCLKNVMSLSK